MFLLFFSVGAIAINFDELDSRTKNYIIEQLARALPDANIAIIHGRRDESYRSGDATLSVYHQVPLGLIRGRLVTILKGDPGLGDYEVIYFYVPERVAPGRPRPRTRHSVSPPYHPAFSFFDNLTRLVLMNRETSILKERILPGYSKRTKQMKEFIEDTFSMDTEDLMDKHKLRDVFSYRVFRLIDGCMFHVEWPVPDLPETKLMSMNWDNWQLTKAQTPEVQEWSKKSLMHLSDREVSEIVFIAYMLEGDEGIAKYSEAARSQNLLLPMTEPVFKTEIGSKLFEMLELDQQGVDIK
jgi:hypothetical protein